LTKVTGSLKVGTFLRHSVEVTNATTIMIPLKLRPNSAIQMLLFLYK